MIVALALGLLSCGVQTDISHPLLVRTAIATLSCKAVPDTEQAGLYPVRWQEGDQISINGTVSQPLPDSYDGLSDACFAFASLEGAAPLNMLYPACAGGDRVTLDGAKPAMYAVTAAPEETALFHQLTAGIRIELYGSLQLASLSLQADAGETIGGDFSVSFPSGGLTVLEGTSILSRPFGTPAALSATEPLILFWFIHPGTCSDGLTLQAASPSGDTRTWHFGRGTSLQKGKMYAVEPISFVADIPNIPDDTDDPKDPTTDGFDVSIEEMTGFSYEYQL